MPSWRRVIVSGSDSSLNSLFVTNYVTGSFTGSFTGSLLGTASYANLALTASYFSGSISNAVSSSYALSSSYSLTASYALSVLGGVGGAFPYTGSAGISGSLIITGSTSISGTINVNSPNVTLGQFVGNQNGYVEFSVRNTSTGISASGDIAVYADTGTVINNYIDLGINNSNLASDYFYSGTNFGNALDAYLYNVGGNLRIGNATSTAPFSQSLFLFSNPAAFPDITITGSRVGIQKTGSLAASLDVNGTLLVATSSIVLSGSQAGVLFNQTISQSVGVSGSSIYGVNITPSFFNTNSSQTQTALRVLASFTGSASGSNTTNRIVDFGSVSAGSQLTVTDQTSGSIYMVNDVSGLPIIEATSDWSVNMYNYPNVVFRKTGSAIIISGSLLVSGGITGSMYGTASYAVTAAYAMNAGGGSGAGFPYSGSAVITGSLLVSGSGNAFIVSGSQLITGNLTVSGTLYAQNMVTVTQSILTNYIVTGSLNLSGSLIVTGSAAFANGVDSLAIVGGRISVSASAAPSGGMVLTATSPTTATWQHTLNNNISVVVSTGSIGFNADAYLTGSFIVFPSTPIVGTTYKLKFDVTKTAVGTATPILTIRTGTTGTMSDTARLVFTFGAGTAVADNGVFEVILAFRTAGTAATIVGNATLLNNLTTTGLSNAIKARTSASVTFDATSASFGIGASYNGGTAATHSVQFTYAEGEV